jgi:hypothetical protein
MINESRSMSVGIGMGYRLDGRGLNLGRPKEFVYSLQY